MPEEWSPLHAVSLQAFRSQLDILAEEGWHVVVPEALECPLLPPKSVVMTFDDGHASDLTAARELARRGIPAAFFVTCKRLGSPGFLDHSQVCELDSHGFRIGSHGLTHTRFTDLAPEEIHSELNDSKQWLECLIGKPVNVLAIPFGFYDSTIVAGAIAAGYQHVLTSDFAVAIAGSYVLSRLPMHSRTTLEDFRSLLSGSCLSVARLRITNGIRRRLGRLWSDPVAQQLKR